MKKNFNFSDILNRTKLILIHFLLISGIIIATVSSVFPANDTIERANHLWWTGNYPEAIKLYEEAASNPVEEKEARIQLAALYRSLCKYAEAIEQYRILLLKGESLGGNPVDPSWIKGVWIPLAYSCFYINLLDEAEMIFRSTLSALPDNLETLFGLGMVLHAKSQFADAEEVFTKATFIDAGFPGNYYYLADIARIKGETGKAALFYDKAIKLDPQQAELFYSLGELHRMRGSPEEAFKHFYRLSTIDSGNTIVIAKLDEVRPLLTRKEEELVPSRILSRFSPISQVPKPEGVPILRIGLNTSSQGNLLPMKTLSFVSSGDFTIISSNSLLLTGIHGVEYTLEVLDERVSIKSGSGRDGKILPSKFLIKQGISESGNLLPEGSTSPEANIPRSTPLKEGSFIIRRVEYARGFAWAGIEDRQYRGNIEVSAGTDGFTLINELNLEEYLYSVVSSEMPASFPMEALKAQAVIARSYALHRKQQIKPHIGEGFDLCDGQHCQVYRGATNESEKTTQAVNETRGIVLTFDDNLISPFYHANCGGHTQSSEDLPGWGSYDYLKGILDAPPEISFPSSPSGLEEWIKSLPQTYCNSNPATRVPEFRWFRIIPVNFIQEKINRYKQIGDIKSITILGRNTSGHVRSVRIEGSRGSITLEKENELRRFIGLGPLRSNLFWLEIKYSKNNLPEHLIIYGGGWGHGVGMCQSGAGGMAQRGLSFKEILSHYYQGTEIETLDY